MNSLIGPRKLDAALHEAQTSALAGLALGAGAIGYANREFYREGALTDRPLDLLGAGDAVLAVVAPFAKAGFSIKELVHLGMVAGAIKVAILGHQDHIRKYQLEEGL